MGTINIQSNGKTGTLSHTVSARVFPLQPPQVFKLHLKGSRGYFSVKLFPSSVTVGDPGSVTFSSSSVPIGALANCSACEWYAATYKVEAVYTDPSGRIISSTTIETGSVTASGTFSSGCKECGDEDEDEDEDGDGDGDGGGGDNPFGPTDPGDDLPPAPSTPEAPCLTPPYSPPPVPVPTPCAAGSGSGGGPGGFGNP